LRLFFSTGQIYGKKLSVWQNVVGGVVRLSKIKCAAKALACDPNPPLQIDPLK